MEFILESVAQCVLVKWHMALEQVEVEWDEAITEGISDCLVSGNALISVSGIDLNPRSVSVIRDIDPQIMTICPLRGCLPEIIVTVEDISVVDGHHFLAANFDSQLLHDGATQILNHCPVGIFAVRGQTGHAAQGWGIGQAVAGSGRGC